MTKSGHDGVSESESNSVLVPTSNFRRWLLIGLLFVASFINYLDRATISIALPLISLDLHLGPEAKGVVLSAFFWSYAASQIPVGLCVDRLNLRWLYAALFAVWSLACGFTGFAGSLTVLILVRMVLGIGESIYFPGGTKIVSLLFPSAGRGLPSGLFDSGTRFGLAVGAPLIAALITHYGWRNMFALVGFTALLWIVPWLLAAPRNLKSPPRAVAAAGSAPRKRLHVNRNLVGLCLGFFCYDYYWYLYVTWIPDYLVTVRHLTLVRAGFYSALPYLVFGVLQSMGGWIADTLIRRGWNETRTRKTILGVAYLFAIALIPAERATTPQGALTFLVAGAFVGLANGNMITMLQCCAPHEEVGIWTGIVNFVGNIGGIFAPIVTGILIARTGSYLAPFTVAVAILLAGILAYCFVVGDLNSARDQNS